MASPVRRFFANTTSVILTTCITLGLAFGVYCMSQYKTGQGGLVISSNEPLLPPDIIENEANDAELIVDNTEYRFRRIAFKDKVEAREAEEKRIAEEKRKAKEAAERKEKERLAKLEAERKEKARLAEQERLAKIEKERKEKERLAKIEKERLEKLEAERKEKERLAKIEAERKAEQARIVAENAAKEAAADAEGLSALEDAGYQATLAEVFRRNWNVGMDAIGYKAIVALKIDRTGKIVEIVENKSQWSGNEAFDSNVRATIWRVGKVPLPNNPNGARMLSREVQYFTFDPKDQGMSYY